ncbi:NF-X1-type zinc finger protein NFXL1 [Mercurialis annua]|uniref:NF-X1-type zinc finger protein NFXL1 n=1 Tax=Mercurialis annua TaxID=3986 RepID=UPI0024ADCE7D|nr:NF-X1-type zinc finger protein NFXL1 [Mercurialis annua]
MSFPQSRNNNDRRDGIGSSRLPNQNARQTWVPRGPPTPTAVVNPPPPFNSEPSGIASGTHSNQPNPRPSRNTENNVFRGRRMGPSNYRRDLESGREKSHTHGVKELKEKDPNLPQLLQEIQEKLVKGTVECMICYDMVRRSAPVWSCSSCYSVFHLSCIKKWARAPTSSDLSAEMNQGFNWRCPGCQSVQLTSSKEIRYVCFCRKRIDPPSDLYLTPHSCGEPCGKPLEKGVPGPGESKEDLCPHVCVLQCHPGPCPPCKAFAPPRVCPCGKKVITTRCFDRTSVLTCGQHCDKLLECGRHRCEKMCHVGPCDPCQVLVNASCFCKKSAEVLLCGDIATKGEVKVEDGVFFCDSTCGKMLGCGNHFCYEVCHPGPCGDCELMPGRVKSCNCGKSCLQVERKSCLDPIPNCTQICGKSLRCERHHCKEVCHGGDCPPCLVLVTQKCRCGSTSRTVECFKTSEESEKFTCEKPCGRKKNCGRHRCSERCCPLSNPNNLLSGDWDPHFCQMACGKKLRCGQHSCESLCHSGHCPPCLETIFTDLTCACGKTSIPPPLPCGTPPPSCQLPCSIPQPCGHSASHSCHFGDCPPCSVPIAKECVGGHVVLGNIPCGSKDIRCNKLCGKTRQCGLHACGRTCHPSPCDNTSCGSEAGSKTSCGQTCGAPRRDCRHTCMALCHPAAFCPDVRCEFPVMITCSCGRITTSVPCDAGGSNGGFNADSVFEASVVRKLPAQLQPVESTGKKVPLGQRKLMCDDECAKLERKRMLADAFDIGHPNLEALHFGEVSAVTELLSDLYRRDPKWVLAVEERCKYLVLGKNRGSLAALKVHIFCPMLKDKRDAVRLIAERWKLAIYSTGREPKRFIVVHATLKSKPPSRVIGIKGTTTLSAPHPAVFDPLVDMDPRLVVSFLDLPREADISSLVLRFGGECELVWLNDKNALAVFNDPARAATAMRRLDHGSVYHGAVVVHQNGSSLAATGATNPWGAAAGGAKEGGVASKSWKKAVAPEYGWKEDPWGGGEEWSHGSADVQPSAWRAKEAPMIAASVNRWTILDPESAAASSSVPSNPAKQEESSSTTVRDSNISSSNLRGQIGGLGEAKLAAESADVAEDWEKAYDNAIAYFFISISVWNSTFGFFISISVDDLGFYACHSSKQCYFNVFCDRHRKSKETWRHTLILSFQSLGVVYGRISTAPLYVFGTIPTDYFVSDETAYEYFSFIFWTMTIISLLKYAFIVLRANDNGEGGTFALYSLLCRNAKVGLLPDDRSTNEIIHHEFGSPERSKVDSRARRAIEKHKSSHYLMLFSALLGACMIIGDAVLTPSISVLSASSGLQRWLSKIKYSSSEKKQRSISDALESYVPVPLACAVLVCLFMLQKYGTPKIGSIFAPVVTIWLLFISGVGIYNIIHYNPKILGAISPAYMYKFVKNINKRSWRSLGSILLCVAGSEAMFADLGHFSKKSIQMTFSCLIYPLLILCYAGQAAYISKNVNASNDFNHLSKSMPDHLGHIFIVLSLLASVTGSQATITASFSIISQCLALGCFPRVKVIHTSNNRRGQVYIPDVNWLLMILCLTVTIGFRDLHKIASAAGLAIVSGMVVTTCLMSLVIALQWEKPLYMSACFLLVFGFVEAVYLSACLLSFHKGGWYLIVLSALTFTIMLSWHYGTKKKYELDLQNKVPTEWLTDFSPGLGVSRVPGIGLIYTDIVSGIPAFFSHFITNLPAFHQVLIFVSFKSLPVPHIPPSERYLVGRIGPKEFRIYRCIVRYGYCDYVRDTDDFEEQIIRSIGEFILSEENDCESLTSSEGRMVVVGKSSPDGNALIPLHESSSSLTLGSDAQNPASPNGDIVNRKKVRFMLPVKSRKMGDYVREELQELINARESGTAYLLGQSHLTLRENSNFIKRFLIMSYVFLDKNCREPPVALNIPHAALVEVGMVYTI